MGRSRYQITEPTAPHFVTCTVLHWLPIFTHLETVDIVMNTLRFLQKEGLKVYAWVILENHLHMVLQSDDLSRDLMRFKSFTARELMQYLKNRNAQTLLNQFEFYKKAHKVDRQLQFWQEGSHPELIQGAEMMRQKVEYIHQNPVKRGYVDLPQHWRNSSARSYLGEQGLLDVWMEW